jgi:hypothetical protein
MCPFCLATAAWITVAAVSTSGAAALVISKVATAKSSTHNPPNSQTPDFPTTEDHNG